MGFPFFENAINSEMLQQPNDLYRGLEQEFINQQWNNSTTVIEVQEQQDIGSDVYDTIEVWITPTMQETTRGLADVNDFNKLVFKSIDHRIKRGQMYIFDNNYWITHSYNEHNGLAQSCGVRRCNNVLKIVDPLDGELKIFPCCIDYDMASPSAQINRYINTPNNHAVVMVQGNEETLRLLKINTRYLLSGRPFKLLAYQNTIEYSMDIHQTTLLYLEMYLDELHDKDDIINGVADNSPLNYSLIVNNGQHALTLSSGSSGVIPVNISLNNIEIDRSVVWESSDNNIVAIGDNGSYTVTGIAGQNALITAYLKDDKTVKDTVAIGVSAQIEDRVFIEPVFSKMRQYETIDFEVKSTLSDFILVDVSILDNNGFIELTHRYNNAFSITALKITKEPLVMKIIGKVTGTEEIVETKVLLNVVSMFG